MCLKFSVGLKTTLYNITTLQHSNVVSKFQCCTTLDFFFFFFFDTTLELLKVFFSDIQSSQLNQKMTNDCLEIYVNCTHFVQKLSSGTICEQFMYNLRKSTKQFHVMFWVNWQKNYVPQPSQPPSLPLFTISNLNFS